MLGLFLSNFKRFAGALAACAWLIAMLPAHATMEIQIFGGASNKIPVALIPFQGPADQPRPALTDIVGQDLLRSGQFKLIDPSAAIEPSSPSQVNYQLWKGRGAEAVAVGNIARLPGGRFQVRFYLMDTLKQTQLAAYSFSPDAAQWRATAHRIADIIYQKLTGVPGSFSTRIAYVQKRGKTFELKVADADGENPHTVVRSLEPIISPSFSPDGSRMAYVSFEDKKPVVYVQRLSDGSRLAVAAFKGSNSAPAWSPDGKQLAVTLTRDNNSQLYLINADGGGLIRLTQDNAIDTEPVFSPDGKWIYFTSDRGGNPQIYKIASSGGKASRVTFNGNYNVSPAISPNGKQMAYIQRDSGRYHVALMELGSGQVRVLTETDRDQSPKFSPNGQMILYATVLGGKGILGTVSIDGMVRTQLSEQGADEREPAWGS
jgi:TolB protein